MNSEMAMKLIFVMTKRHCEITPSNDRKFYFSGEKL